MPSPPGGPSGDGRRRCRGGHRRGRSEQPFATIAFTEEDKLLSGAKLRPGQGSFEEPGGEALYVRTELTCPADDAVGRTQGIGGLLCWTVRGVGHSGAAGHASVDLHEFTLLVELHEPSVSADFELRSRRTRGGRGGVKGLAEADVMVRVDGHLLPLGHVVKDAVIGLQRRRLLGFEDRPR